MKVLHKFADKSGPGSNLIVSWDEKENCIVFLVEGKKEPFLRLLPDTLLQIVAAVEAERSPHDTSLGSKVARFTFGSGVLPGLAQPPDA